jgi:hypothetical protein
MNMSSIRRTELTHSLVQSFSGARAALEDVFQHYKMGRYGEAFPEKSYFLLSRCTHVLFSLWLAEQENERGFFGLAVPAAFTLGLDFGELRYSEYKRRMLHGDEIEEHLRNETKWFEFWLRILEQFDKANAPAYQKFCQDLLAWVREPGFLEGKAARAHRKALHAFMMGDETGRVLTGTLRLLEDLLRTVVGCFTTPENRTCVAEQMILLTGLLGEMRRILLWETPAKGPYALGGQARWRNPSPLRRLLGGRTQGFLTVVPKREGGEIVCTFQPTPGSAGRRAAWMRRMTSLAGTYEAELFATWSYGSGAHAEHPDQFPGLQACWTVQNAEAGRLEVLSKQIDSLLDVLQQDPACTPLAAAVRGVSRNAAPEWQAVCLPWTYVSQLDQMMDKLTFIYREAKAVGGDDAALRVIERIWPSGKSPAARGAAGDNRNRQQEERPRTPASAPATESAPRSPAKVVPGTLASLLQRARAGRTRREKNLVGEREGNSVVSEMSDKPAGAETVNPGSPGEIGAVCEGPQADIVAPGGSEAERAPTPLPPAGQEQGMGDKQESKCVPPCGHTEQKDSEAESRSGASEAATAPGQPDSADDAGSSGSAATGPERAAIPAPRARRPRRPAPATKAADADRPSDVDRALVHRLLEHHEQPDGTINHEPLSSTDLRRDLGWSLSKVQRALTSIFGPKPTNAYRIKCKDRTICAFLKAQAGGEKAPGAPVRPKPQKARKAPGVPAKTKARRPSRRRVSV